MHDDTQPPYTDDDLPPDDVDNIRPLHPQPERRPPTAEQALLGAILTEPTLAERLRDHINPEDFDEPKHEQIWHAIHQLDAEGTLPDAIVVNQHLLATGQLTRIGNTYVADLVSDCPTTGNAELYAREVRDQGRRRNTRTDLVRALQAVDDPSRDVDDVIATVLDNANQAAARTGPTTTAGATSWAPVDLNPVFEGHVLDPPPDILPRSDGPCLLYSAGIHSIAGEPGSGKTWITLLATTQLITAGLPVIFIDFEDRPERVISRLHTLGADTDDIRNHFTYIRPDRPLDTTTRRDLAPHLYRAVLVILDGVTEAMTVHGLDLNSNEDAAKFYGILPRWIADQGPAVVMIDHVVKDAERRGRYALGAQHKLAGIDSASYTVRLLTPFGRGKRGLARIDIAKDRPGHVAQHATGNQIATFTLDDTEPGGAIATLDRPTETPTTDDGSWVPTVLMERVSVYIRTNPAATQRNIFDAIRGGKDTHKRLAIDTLLRRGYIRAETGPRRSIQHHHIKPYPDPNQDES